MRLKIRSYFFLLLTLCIIISQISCNNKPHQQDNKSDPYNQSKVSFYFTLKKNERCFLNYANSFFEGKMIVFSNPGNRDTVITKEVSLDEASVFSYGFFTGNSSDPGYQKYILLVYPGDTIRLSLNNGFCLNTEKCSSVNVISGGSVPYYNEDGLVSKYQNWDEFHEKINELHKSELNRIDTLLKASVIDSSTYKKFSLYCNLRYYNRHLDWINPKSSRYFGQSIPFILDQLPEIESLLNNENLFLSNDLCNLIEGIVRCKSINENKDEESRFVAYGQAEMLQLGKYRQAYLAKCIVHSPVKKGQEFENMLIKFRQQYKNTVFPSYVDSMLNNATEGKQINTTDSLLAYDGNIVAWDSLFKSKRGLVVIDFWASWCVPCRQLFPHIDDARGKLKKYPVEFISVNIDEDIEDWRVSSDILKKYLHPNNYHLVRPKESAIIKRLNIISIPRIVLMEKSKVVASDFYKPDDKYFIKEIARLINN